MNLIKVIIVESHPLLCQGLCQLCQSTPRLKVVATAKTGQALMQNLERIPPDVIVIGNRIPLVELLHHLPHIAEDIPILLLANPNQPYELYRAIRAGIRCYLLPTADTNALFSAIDAIHSGKYLIDPQMAQRAFNQYQYVEETECLTESEMKVLCLVAYGKDNKEIAKDLNSSMHTIANRLRTIYEKLYVTSRTQAMLYALRRGWVQLEQIKAPADYKFL